MVKAVIVVMSTLFGSCALNLKVGVNKERKEISNSDKKFVESGDKRKDFLRYLDGMRGPAIEGVLKTLASRDYVSGFRNSIRQTRNHIVNKSEQKLSLAGPNGGEQSDDFYTDDSVDCRSVGDVFSGDQSLEAIGLIIAGITVLQLSETEFGKLNPTGYKESRAVVEFLSLELGVVVSGKGEVIEEGDKTILRSNSILRIKPISSESFTPEQLKEDESGVLAIQYERVLSKNGENTFKVDIDIPKVVGQDLTQYTSRIGLTDVSRDQRHQFNIDVATGASGLAPNYERRLIFEEERSNKARLGLSYLIMSNGAVKKRIDTYIDALTRKQCKIKSN